MFGIPVKGTHAHAFVTSYCHLGELKNRVSTPALFSSAPVHEESGKVCVFCLFSSIVPLPQGWSKHAYSFHCASTSVVDLFSSVPWPIGSSGGHEGWFSRDPLPVFSAEGPCEQFWHGQGCPLFDLSIQHFLFWPQHCSPSEVLWRKVLESPLWCVTSSLWSLMHMICTYVLMQWSQDSKRVHLFRRQLGLSCGIFCFMSGVCREQSAHLVHWIQCGIWQVLVLFSRSVLVRSKKKITLHFCSDLSNDHTSEHTHTQCCFCFLLPTLSFCLHDCGSGKCYSVKKRHNVGT